MDYDRAQMFHLETSTEEPAEDQDDGMRVYLTSEVTTEVSVGDLIRTLGTGTRLRDFIIEMDMEAGSWDLTLELWQYFEEQRRLHNKEFPENQREFYQEDSDV